VLFLLVIVASSGLLGNNALLAHLGTLISHTLHSLFFLSGVKMKIENIGEGGGGGGRRKPAKMIVTAAKGETAGNENGGMAAASASAAA